MVEPKSNKRHVVYLLDSSLCFDNESINWFLYEFEYPNYFINVGQLIVNFDLILTAR